MKALVFSMGVVLLSAGVFAAEQTWTGAISDKMCGSDHKKMGGKMSDRDCTVACAKGGVSYVLVFDGKIYELRNRDSNVKMHAGQNVTVTGELKGDTIHVAKIEMAAKSR